MTTDYPTSAPLPESTHLIGILRKLRRPRCRYRELQRVDTALEIVRLLFTNLTKVARETATAPSLVLEAERCMLSDFIQQHRLLGPLPKWDATDAGVNLLQQLKTCGTEEELRSTLSTLARLLRMRRIILERGNPWYARKVTRKSEQLANTTRNGNEQSKLPLPTMPKVGTSASEAALLATLTEKFYSSWAFRIVGGVLVAAAFLVGTGTFFLGGQVLQLNDGLQKTAASTNSDVKEFAKTTHDGIDEQERLFATWFTGARTEIDSRVNEFTRDADQLKRTAVTEFIKTIKEDLQKPESDLQTQIALIGDEHVKPLQQAVDSLDRTVSQLGSAVSKDNDKVKDVGSKLDELDSNINKQKSKLAELRQSLAKLSEVETNVARAEEVSNQVVTDLTQAENRVKALGPRLNSIEGELAGLESAVKKSDEDQGKLKVSSVKTEADLVRTEWQVIQQALNAAGYATGSTDGKPGPTTRQAIRRFQAKIGTKRTGHLSPEEIGQLIGTPSLAR